MHVGYRLADGGYIIPVGFFPGRQELFWPTGIIRIPVVSKDPRPFGYLRTRPKIVL
jgi:hypothetical protein